MAGCVPCIIIPLLLFIFHRFIQPLILKYWNPWKGKSDKEIDEKLEKMLCKDGTCYNKSKQGNIVGNDTKTKTS